MNATELITQLKQEKYDTQGAVVDFLESLLVETQTEKLNYCEACEVEQDGIYSLELTLANGTQLSRNDLGDNLISLESIPSFLLQVIQELDSYTKKPDVVTDITYGLFCPCCLNSI